MRGMPARAGAALTAAGVSASWDLLVGPTADCLMDVAQRGDVIVMTSHGGGATRWLLGSTAEKLVRHGPIPVIVLRAAPAVGLATSREAGQLVRVGAFAEEGARLEA